jgi:hypothetical protein
VYVSTDDADPKSNYFGYMSVNFDITDETGAFFAETFESAVLKEIRDFFKDKPNYDVEKEIRLEDWSVLIDLARVDDKIYATDVLKIVKRLEEEFIERAGL